MNGRRSRIFTLIAPACVAIMAWLVALAGPAWADTLVVRSASVPGARMSADTVVRLELVSQGARITGAIPEFGMYRVEVSPERAKMLQADPAGSGLAWARPEVLLHTSLVPNDPGYPYQWWATSIDVPPVWGLPEVGNPVTLAVLDTGVNTNLPDFAGRFVGGVDIVSGSTAPGAWLDTYGHGTWVASVAAATGNNRAGIAGVSWSARIMPVKIGSSGTFSDFDAAQGILYAVDHGAQVLNMSWGAESRSLPLAEAVSYARARGAVLVAAAGNNYGGPVNYPAAEPGVIAVAATTSTNARATFSAVGSALDLAAPGDRVVSNGLYGGLVLVSGTSFSAPMVAGTAALLLSAAPNLTAAQLEGILKTTARDLGAAGPDQYFGAGLVDAAAALAALTTLAPTTTTTLAPTTTTLAPTTTTLAPTTTTLAPTTTTTVQRRRLVPTTTTTLAPTTTTTVAPTTTTTTVARRRR